MIHHPDIAAARPIDVPILLSALGPKGKGIAAEIADGLMNVAPPEGSASEGSAGEGSAGEGSAGEGSAPDWYVHMVNGTVLDPGEDPTADRVVDAAGPWEALSHHGAWHLAGEDIVPMLPGGEEWLDRVKTDRPEEERHLSVHEWHCTHVNERDRPLLAAKGTAEDPWSGWVGDDADIAGRVAATGAAGTTEVLYTPAGPDLEREMRAFARATGLA
jgi:5,10-methylenetetrahydromethanopterin reductase